jgi:hypothetical protein
MHFCFSSLGRNGVRKNLKAKYCKRTTLPSLLQIITIVRNIQHKPHKFDFQIFPIVITQKDSRRLYLIIRRAIQTYNIYLIYNIANILFLYILCFTDYCLPAKVSTASSIVGGGQSTIPLFNFLLYILYLISIFFKVKFM